MLQLRKDGSGMDGGEAGLGLGIKRTPRLLQGDRFQRRRTSTGKRRDTNLAERFFVR